MDKRRSCAKVITQMLDLIPENKKELISKLTENYFSTLLKAPEETIQWELVFETLQEYIGTPKEDWEFEVFSIFSTIPVEELKNEFKQQNTSNVVNKTQFEISKSLAKLKEFEEKYWVTQTKEKIKIKDLTIEHLGNIIKYLNKLFNKLDNPIDDYPSFQGEMAQIYAEQQWQASMNYYNQLQRTIKLFESYYKLKTL